MATNPKVVNIWASRIVPTCLAGAVGYATFVFVKRLCVDYLLNHTPRRSGVAIALLTIYFILTLCMVITYLRLLYTVTYDPGYLPLGPAAKREKKDRLRSSHSKRERSGDNYGHDYASSGRSIARRDDDTDSLGLELFYTKRIFVCSQDGRPKWCSECANWKLDRTHHCSDVGRCVYKMDHYCPWVGGVVGENSFKFFVQFVTYACVYCIFCVICTAIYLRKQVVDPGMDWDRQFVALLALAGFFGAFTGGMSGSSLQFVLYNLTTIENLSKTRRPYTLAVLIPPSYEIPKEGYYPHVTYPLPIPDSNSPRPVESLTHALNDRDAKAQRTFAILQLGIGRNPWDLGFVQNFKEVMGNSFAEWVLPIKRSPLCNHENDESQFRMGRWVEQLLVDVGFMKAEEMRNPKPVSKPYEETPKGIKAAKKARQEGGDVEIQPQKKVGMTAEGIPRRAQ